MLRGSVRSAAIVAAALVLSWMGSGCYAADEKDKGMVKEGSPAPTVELPATSIGTVLPDKKDAKTLSLKDLEGKKNVVLYFFPKALTGG
jgi:hypothetical protein